MSEEPPPAIKRAVQLMGLPVNQIPIPAVLYAAWLCNKYGMCGEVFMTAYCVYAQIAEGLSVEDDALYGINETIRAEWDEVQRDFIMINLPDGRIQVVRKNA
jgi:hypothetical protein